MLTLLLAAAAATVSPTHGFGPRVTSQAQASVRIVRAARIDFSHPGGLDEAKIHRAAVHIDGVVQEVRLIEFQ